jgi:CelD/BcsL family acetyltransferase involved in cellulose biosynthesis
MLVDVIDSFERFNGLRENWETIYGADPEAQFFLSWTWLSQWLPAPREPWFILAARPSADARYVAFLPLRLRIKHSDEIGFRNDICMAGNSAADYTGLLCLPEVQDRAITALARCLTTLNWTRLHLENIRMSDERLRLLLARFPARTFRTARIEHINKEDNIDNCICPQVSLPGTWDTYLDGLSANTRQKIRRCLRLLESDDRFRITHADADTIDRDIEILLGFWKARWGARKRDRLGPILELLHTLLPRCFRSGCLFLPVLWREETPLGALASFVDPQKASLLFYVGGRDESVAYPPPGLVLHAHSIRYAMSRGLRTYDFLRGNEGYKYSLGAKEHRIRCLVIATRTGRNIGDRLDPRSLPMVLRHTTRLHRAGQLGAAESGYRQVLDVEPLHPAALYCLGQLMASKRRHDDAASLFRTLLSVQPDHGKAWARLAESIRAQAEVAAAGEGRHDLPRQHGLAAAQPAAPQSLRLS